MKNKILVILLVVLAVVAVGYLVFSSNKQIAQAPIKSPDQANKNLVQPGVKTNEPVASTGQPEKAKVDVPTVEMVAKNELPKGFPGDIPLEAGAEITLNLNTINPIGGSLAVREFISAKTVAENYALYQKALKENGWKITSAQENTPLGNLIDAEKDKNKLNIRIYVDAVKKVIVSISNMVIK